MQARSLALLLYRVLLHCLLQGILKDAELRAYWTYCQQYPLPDPQQQQQQHSVTSAAAAAASGDQADFTPHQVLLPLTALAHSKQLTTWLRQQQQQHHEFAESAAGSSSSSSAVDGDVPAVMRQIRALLQQQNAAGKLLPGVHQARLLLMHVAVYKAPFTLCFSMVCISV